MKRVFPVSPIEEGVAVSDWSSPESREARRRQVLARNAERARAKTLRPLEPASLSPENLKLLKQSDQQRTLAAVATHRATAAHEGGATKVVRSERGVARAHLGEARRLAQTVTADLQARTDARWIGVALEETAALEAGRGEQVERAPGRVRIKSRDGLLAMRDASPPAITPEQHAAGLRFRDLVDVTRASLRSQLGALEIKSRTPALSEGWAARRMRAVRDQADAESAVRAVFGAREWQADRAVRVLRLIAGDGLNVRQVVAEARDAKRGAEGGDTVQAKAASGHARREASKALKLALDALVQHFGVTRGGRVSAGEFSEAERCAWEESRDEEGEHIGSESV